MNNSASTFVLSEFNTRHMTDKCFREVSLIQKDSYVILNCGGSVLGVLQQEDEGFIFYDSLSKNWDSPIYRSFSDEDLLDLVDCLDSLYHFYKSLAKFHLWKLYKNLIYFWR